MPDRLPASRQRPRALREALHAIRHPLSGSPSSEASTPASESPSEEDYDEITAPPADAMLLRQRRKARGHVRNGSAEADDATPEVAATTSHGTGALRKGGRSRPQPANLDGLASTIDTAGSPMTSPSGRKLSATVIFEEKGGAPPAIPTLSSAATAVSSSASADDEASGPHSIKELYPSPCDGDKRSFVISIDDPKLAEILRADLEQIREDMEEQQEEQNLQKKRKQQHKQHQVAQAAAAAPVLASDDKAPTAIADAADAAKALAAEQPHHHHKRRRRPFSDFVFTRAFSTFDRQNAAAANTPFHGFFTLFWISVFMFMVKIGADNWRKTGSPLGTNEILHTMFRRDLVVMLLSDGVLCALTGVSWLIQLIVLDGRLMEWDGAGWIVQHMWQTFYIAAFIGWTQLRDWPWSHTVFFVLHGLVMLMKQHSYAFYNGYLSSLARRRTVLQAKLEELRVAERATDADAAAAAALSDEPSYEAAAEEAKDTAAAVTSITTGADAAALAANPDTVVRTRRYRRRQSQVGGAGTINVTSPAALDTVIAALQSGQPLDCHQVRVFERILHWEIDGLTEELRGKSTRPEKAYPNNLTFANHYEFIVLPTLVYELEYPRTDTINWRYAAEKLVAIFGIIFVMIMISQAFIYPVVMHTLAMKAEGIPLAARFKEFPWMMSDLIFPFMMEYLLTWYLIWETILNFLAEITCFADRSFYSSWWNSVTWDDFARDWNRPVHLFLLRHVYHSSISAMKVNKHTATLITFFLSACVHELVMWCIFKKLRGYLLFLQMCQLPLVRLSRTRWMRHRETLGNVMFWTGIFMGPSILCSLYLIL